MKTCTCGRPVSAGHSGSDSSSSARCLICRTAETMRGWSYPASTQGQKELREKKAQSR